MDDLDALEEYGAPAAVARRRPRPPRRHSRRRLAAVAAAVLAVAAVAGVVALVWPDPAPPVRTPLVLPAALPDDLVLTDALRAADGATLRSPWDVHRQRFVDAADPSRALWVVWRERWDGAFVPGTGSPVVLPGGRPARRRAEAGRVLLSAAGSPRSAAVVAAGGTEAAAHRVLARVLDGEPVATPDGFAAVPAADPADAVLAVRAGSPDEPGRRVEILVHRVPEVRRGTPPGAGPALTVGDTVVRRDGDRDLLAVADGIVVAVRTTGLTDAERRRVFAGIVPVGEDVWRDRLLAALVPPDPVEQRPVAAGRVGAGPFAGRTWTLVERRRPGAPWCPALGIDSGPTTAAGPVCPELGSHLVGPMLAGRLPDGADAATVRFTTPLGEVAVRPTIAAGPSGERYVVAEGPVAGEQLLVGWPVVEDGAGRTVRLG